MVSVTAFEMVSNVTLSEPQVTIARVRTLFISRYLIISTPLDLILHKYIKKSRVNFLYNTAQQAKQKLAK